MIFLGIVLFDWRPDQNNWTSDNQVAIFLTAMDMKTNIISREDKEAR